MNTQTRRFYPIMITGIILILLGGLLIAGNVGLVPHDFKKIILSWQMLLIIVGIVSIAKRQTFHFHGLSLVCVGIFFIIPKVAQVFPAAFSDIDAANFVATYWPALLIASGIIMVSRIFLPVTNHRWHSHQRYRCCRARFRERSKHFGNDDNNRTDDKSRWNSENCWQGEYFSKACIFSNGRYIVVDTEFKGGSLHAIFGGIELDLRKAYLPEGETTITIEAIFGGVDLLVPDNWVLEVNIESVLGGVDDSRRIYSVADTSRKLIIKGSAVFGGVEIRN
ncbi:MAG: cell wall-active antibiotics response protein [Prevotellaceae bacterium]|nr:cell wall-active antibiotics response protein [Prevotellaceae bacterium]